MFRNCFEKISYIYLYICCYVFQKIFQRSFYLFFVEKLNYSLNEAIVCCCVILKLNSVYVNNNANQDLF